MTLRTYWNSIHKSQRSNPKPALGQSTLFDAVGEALDAIAHQLGDVTRRDNQTDQSFRLDLIKLAYRHLKVIAGALKQDAVMTFLVECFRCKRQTHRARRVSWGRGDFYATCECDMTDSTRHRFVF